MNRLDQIKLPIVTHLEAYDQYIRDNMMPDDPHSRQIIEYILGNRGKSLRPTLVLLTAASASADGQLPEGTLLSAMMVEMMHTASLVHDDVIDGSNLRRGKASVNALWDSHTAVIIGDYILARTFRTGMENRSYDVINFLMKSMSDLCEGELIQSYRAVTGQMNRETYFDIIYKKTASLIETSCGAGPLSVGADYETVNIYKEYGRNLGMAFQIKDDILDYGDSAQTGKPSYGDLREKKITLPMLTVLEGMEDAERTLFIQELSDSTGNEEKIASLARTVTDKGGIEMATEVMLGYLKTARELTGKFASNRFTDSLILLCDFIHDRNN